MSGELSRRDALTIMAIAPLAASLGTTPDVIEGAMAAAQRAQEQAAKQQPEPGKYKPQFFDEHEWRTVRVLADLIIPRDERSGSATDAGVPEFIDFMMMDRPNMQLQMRGGLRWLDNRSQTNFGERFVALNARQQTTVLDEIAYPDEAKPEVSHGVSFFNFFRDLTAAGFWSSRIGVQDLGYMGNEWRTEWHGCPPEANARLGVSPEVMNTRIPIQRG